MAERIRHDGQSVTVSGHGRAGDITLIGKIVNVAGQPAAWQEAVWRLISRHKGFLVGTLAVEAGLVALYLRFRDLYLIPSWYGGLVALLFAAAAWSWYRRASVSGDRKGTLLALALTLSLAGLLGWKSRQIMFPDRFPPSVFGIAVAELGEGPDFGRTARAREMSDQIYEHLCRAIQQEFATDAQDPCSIQAGRSGAGRVELKRIGVMSDSQTARAFGQRLGAGVVIWGQVLTSNVGAAVVRFQILETPDRALVPEFPLVLPVTASATEIFANELDLASDPVKLKGVIAQQSTIITSFALGLASFLERDYAQAVKHLETTVQALEQSPAFSISSDGKSLLYYYLGKASHARGRISQGQEWLTRAREANPREPAVPLSLALGYRSLGQQEAKEANLDLALNLIGTWLETHPQDSAAIYDRAIVYQVRQQYEDARLDYGWLIQRDPDFYVAYIGLGQVAAALGQVDEAENAYRAAIALAERTGTRAAWSHLNLALLYDSAGNPTLADAEFREAIEIAPDVEWMYYHYGSFLEGRGELGAAQSIYQTLTQVARDKGWAYGNLAKLFLRHGLFQEALENFKQAVHYQPEDALLHTYMAETYLALDDVERALGAYEEAVRYGEELYYVFASFGVALFQTGNLERAAQVYERSLALRPLDGAVMLNLGQTYESLGRAEEARELYRRTLSLRDQFSQDVVGMASARLAALEVESR